MTRLNTTIPEELKITQHWSQPIGLRQGVLVAGLFAFLLSVLTYSENLPFNIVPKLTVLLLLQCAAGGALWQWLSKDDAVSIPLFVGVGLALGSMLIVALDQIFLLLNLGKVSHLLTLASLGLIGMSNLVPRKRRNNHIPHDPTSRQVNHWILVGSTFIALLGASAFRPELLPFSIALSVGVLCAMFGWRTHLRTKSTLIRRVRIERNILMLLSVLFTLVAVVSIIQATSDKPQFFPGGDLAHDESLATSVATWGPGDSIQLVGTPIRYHWLALGWIGYVNKILGFEPFVAARVAMPVLVYLSSVLMLWTSLIRSRRLIPYAVIVPIAGMLSAPVGGFGGVFATDASPSNQIGMNWAIITTFAIIQTYRDRLRLGFLVSAILMFFTTGAKGPYGACLVVATLSLVAATVAKERKINRQDIFLGLGVLFGFLFSYLLLISADGRAGVLPY